MGERDHVAVQVILDESGQFAVREDLEPCLVRIVGNLQVHDTSAPPGYPPVPSILADLSRYRADRAKSRASRASGSQGSADPGSRLNHSLIGVPLLASNRSPSPTATSS